MFGIRTPRKALFGYSADPKRVEMEMKIIAVYFPSSRSFLPNHAWLLQLVNDLGVAGNLYFLTVGRTYSVVGKVDPRSKYIPTELVQ
jgi:hypothetical protein